MASRGVFYVVTLALFIAGLLLIIYQHLTFQIPVFPGKKSEVWTVEAKIEFEPSANTAATIDFAIPAIQPNFTQLKQNTSSLGYGTSYIQKQGANYIQWTKRNPIGLQTLYYRADFLYDANANNSSMTVPEIEESVEGEPYATAMDEINDAAYSKSSNPYSYAVQVINEINKKSETTSLLLSKYTKSDLVVKILNRASIPARVVTVLELEDGRRNRSLKNMVAVFDNTSYELYDTTTGNSGINSNQLIWTNHGSSLLDVQGGTNARVSFSILKNSVATSEAGMLLASVEKASGSDIVSLSIDSLPIEEQSVFKTILLLPIGVLIVVFLRIIIGIKTSGTFMPVLISMAFLQTSLVVGLIGFISIVCIGLIVRSWLSYLNLLLIARISAVIITVIAIIGCISVLTYKIGLTEGIKVTFFPMIILSWTIERMSILWEEEGYKEVLVQGGGSLFVAVCAYLAMNSLIIQHITFNFLGLQLIILSLVLIMGNYTGFRLSELKRFKPLAVQIKENLNGDNTEIEAKTLNQKIKDLKNNPQATLKKWQEEQNQNNAKNSKEDK